MKPAHVFALVLTTVGLMSSAWGQVTILTNGLPAANHFAVPPSNIAVSLTLLRHRPTRQTSADADSVGSCRSLPELVQVLKVAGPVEVLGHLRREIACAPSGRIEFNSVETRPAILAQGYLPSPTNHVFGLELHADVTVFSAGSPTAPPFLMLSWNGTWAGSTTLLATWEKLAVRGFTLAAAVPGITYSKVEPDEDGFVNTGGGTDLGGLFRRRKPKDAAKKDAPAKPSKAAKAAVIAAATTEREPSYASEPPPEKIVLQGDWIGFAGQLLVSRREMPAADQSGDLYLVIQSHRAD